MPGTNQQDVSSVTRCPETRGYYITLDSALTLYTLYCVTHSEVNCILKYSHCCILHCNIQPVVHCTLYIPNSLQYDTTASTALCILHCTSLYAILSSVAHCKIYTALYCTVHYTLQYTLYNLNCTLHNRLRYTACTVLFILYIYAHTFQVKESCQY